MEARALPAIIIGTTIGQAPWLCEGLSNAAAVCPRQNAASIMMKPDHDTARPARCGRSLTAPAWPQGW